MCKPTSLHPKPKGCILFLQTSKCTRQEKNKGQNKLDSQLGLTLWSPMKIDIENSLKVFSLRNSKHTAPCLKLSKSLAMEIKSSNISTRLLTS
jgi:hypothetical protein